MKRRLSCIMAVIMLIVVCCLFAAIELPAYAVYTPFPPTRDDGVWLFPLAESYWNSFSDWAGCNWDGTVNDCPFHESGCNISCGAIHKYGDIGHNGVDIAASEGVAVMAAADGVLYTTGQNTAAYRGIVAVVEHKIEGTNWSYYTFYQHLSSAEASLNGQSVKAGQTIGKVGHSDGGMNAGYGNHLHFGMVLGYSGHGSEMATSPNGSGYSISYLQNKGWILEPGYREGMILVNPAENIPLVSGYSDSLQRHPGSVKYTFNASSVSIAGACTSHTIGTFQFSETVHPHYNYYTCSNCGALFTDGSTTYWDSCETCNPPTYTVTYHYMNGSSYSTVSSKKGTSLSIRSTYPTENGYYFSGWAYEADAQYFDLRPGDTITVNSNIDLYPLYISHEDAISGEPVLIYDPDDFTDSAYTLEPVDYTFTRTKKNTTWGDWSAWLPDVKTASDTVQVETAVIYRYYYALCHGCGDHNPLWAACGCGSDERHWVEYWTTIPYSQSNSSVVSYATYKRMTTSLGDGEVYYFSSGNLNDTAVGTSDADGTDVVINNGYRTREATTTTTEETVTVTAYKAVRSNVLDSGYCGGEGDGTNLTWVLTNDGTLTISGEGAMADYGSYNDDGGLVITYPSWRDNYQSSIKNVVIENGVTTIGSCAFFKFSGFEEEQWNGISGELVIPDSVTSIGDRAFAGCDGLTGNLIIPSGMYNIGNRAFYGCSGFTGDLVIPDGVASIGDYAFSGCSGFSGDLVIPGSVVRIGDNAFENCSGFAGSLIISDGVNSIRNYAFSGCSGFSGDLVIPGSVVNIGVNVFENCSGFAGSLIISDGVDSIGNHAFYGCSGLSGDLVIPDSVNFVGVGAFAHCNGFSGKLIISDGLSVIQAWTFLECSGLSGELIIPDSVTYIGYESFHGCSGFSGDLVIPSGVKTLEDNAFYGCSGLSGKVFFKGNAPSSVSGAPFPADFTLYYIPGTTGWTDSDYYDADAGTWNGYSLKAWDGTNFEEMVLSGKCGDNAYWNLDLSTETLTISGTGKMYDYDNPPWYDYRESIQFLQISDGITTIGASAFYLCENLKNADIGGSVSSIGWAAFATCSSLDSIELPDSVVSINHQAFWYSGLKSITIPDSVTFIDGEAFALCYKLESVTLSSGLTTLGTAMFWDCTSLKNIVIPDSITALEGGVFSGCTALETITIPVSVTSIGNSAFYECDSLADVYYGGTETQWNAINIESSNEPLTNATIHFAEEVHTHNLTRTAAKAATCTDPGNIEYWHCADCGKYYSDAAATSEITKADTVIPALGHDYKDGSCTRCGKADPSVPTDAPRLVVQPVTGRPGDTVEVKINVENNPGLVGIATVVTFDSTVLEYVSCEISSEFGGVNNSHLNGNTLKTIWVTGDEAVTVNDTFLTITFKINEDAEDGDTYITLDYDYDNTLDANEECIELATFGDYVTVFSGILGDVNNSGTVTSLDVRWILQYLSGAREFSEDQLALADVNSSGTVTSLDVRWILQYLSGARDENFQAR